MSRTQRRRSTRWLISLVVVLVLLALGAVAAFWRYPIATLVAQERWALRRAGFERASVAAQAGPVTYFRAGSGPLVVLIHGANDTAGSWSRVAGGLAARHRVVVPDLPGHGASAPASGPLAVGDLLGGLEAVLLAEAGGQPAALVGNSLGGFLGLVLATRHADLVARVVLVNGAALREEHPEAAALLLPRTREEARKAFAAILAPSAAPVPGFVLDDLVRRAPRSPLARLMAAPAATVDAHALEGRLASLGVPVALIWGEADRILPPDYARRVQAAIPGSRLTMLPDCGHVPQRECPGPLAAALDVALAAAPTPGERR
jgi:3-oxoadipate enol-lactonase